MDPLYCISCLSTGERKNPSISMSTSTSTSMPNWCSICQNPVSSRVHFHLPCGHPTHKKCLDAWIPRGRIDCYQCTDCVICQMPMSVTNLGLNIQTCSPCGHTFHTRCIQNTVYHNGSCCPVCRKRLPAVQPGKLKTNVTWQDATTSELCGTSQPSSPMPRNLAPDFADVSFSDPLEIRIEGEVEEPDNPFLVPTDVE